MELGLGIGSVFKGLINMINSNKLIDKIKEVEDYQYYQNFMKLSLELAEALFNSDLAEENFNKQLKQDESFEEQFSKEEKEFMSALREYTKSKMRVSDLELELLEEIKSNTYFKNELSYMFDIKEHGDALRQFDIELQGKENTEISGEAARLLRISGFEAVNYRYIIIKTFVNKLGEIVYKLDKDQQIVSIANRDKFDNYINNLNEYYNDQSKKISNHLKEITK